MKGSFFFNSAIIGYKNSTRIKDQDVLRVSQHKMFLFCGEMCFYEIQPMMKLWELMICLRNTRHVTAERNKQTEETRFHERERERECERGENTVLSSVHSSSSIISLHGSRMRTERERDTSERERQTGSERHVPVFIALRSSRQPSETLMSYISEFSSMSTHVWPLNTRQFYFPKYCLLFKHQPWSTACTH